MDFPPMEFDVDKRIWEASGHQLASRQISIEKQTALSTLINELLERDVLRLSNATAWSQVHLVWKLSGGWRFTIDYRALNKVITKGNHQIINEGWQIPNMKEMLQRIGSLKSKGSESRTNDTRLLPNATLQVMLAFNDVHLISRDR